MQIATVLCPIDFSSLDDAEVGLAIEVCRAFGAKLVLHHNQAAAEPGFSRAWEWRKADEAHHPPTNPERRMQAVLDEVAGRVAAEAVMTSGPVTQVILSLAEALPADLVVLGSHGWSTQDHASVTEHLIDRSSRPVLTFEEGVANTCDFRLGRPGETARVVVAADLHRDARRVVAYACALSRIVPLDLVLLHVLTGDTSAAAAAHAQAALDAQVPSDLVDRVAAQVRIGPSAETIVEYVDETRPAFVMLGEHAPGLVRRLLTRSTTRDVLRQLRCPVWVVPPAAVV